MAETKPTFSVVLDTRREKSDGTYPLKLRVTYKRVRKYYNVGLGDFTKEEFEKITTTNPREFNLKKVKSKIKQEEVRSESTYMEMKAFSFEGFESLFYGKEEKPEYTLFSLMQGYIEKLFEQNRVSTAQSYTWARTSLKKYSPNADFRDVTPRFLTDYEIWMIQQGNSITTVGIYLRSLRTIFNLAINEGIIEKEHYPFQRGKYTIPSGRNIKKALTINEIEKIFKYVCVPGSSEEKARDLWLFSYLCNGMNMKDICRLKYKDIEGDKLVYIRAKTLLSTKSNRKPIIVYLTDHAKSIIEKWGQKPVLPSTYVFPILPVDVSPLRERKLVQGITQLVNKYMKRIGVQLGISKPVTTYTARHSFSTVLKRSGVSIEYISESLGHSSLQTTENYLDSFEDDVKRKYADLLTNF